MSFVDNMGDTCKIIKIGNEFNDSRRYTIMITSEEDLATLPVDQMAADSIAKTADYSVYAVLGLDKQWKRLA